MYEIRIETDEIRIDLWILYYDKVQGREANINKR